MAFAPHLSKLLLPIPLAPVLDRRSGIRTDATTNSKACSSSHLTSKMTYSRVIAVTRTAVLIKEGSVFCIALKKKPISSHVGGKNHRRFPTNRQKSLEESRAVTEWKFHGLSPQGDGFVIPRKGKGGLLRSASAAWFVGIGRKQKKSTGEMKAEFVISPPSHMFNLFLAVSPEIFLINATFILLIHGVFFSTSKKDDYPPLVSNVGWLGLLTAARLANRTQQEQGNSPGSGRHMSPNAMLNVRPTLHYVGTCAATCRETCTCGSGRAFLRYLITLLLLAAGAPLLTIAHFFWNHFFRKDNLTYFCQILPLLSTAGTISMCFDFSEQFDASESIVLIPLPTRSMLLMISAHDSIAMYLAIEPQSLCFYVIAASKRKSEFSTEAGSKYLILGAFSSGILLFGCDRTTIDPFFETSFYF
ncbi:hypothetical protein IEQ34_023858 [Dendrobium chrysotoxum]|uniref:NADH:quinone oxidoreductase/Mrp antiporter transmembrane domain-containing protein n=3 Tax=Epidendroideae TaxID=158332 RepID=A0AAV7FMZ1_DENCH|nr:hypothetical protein IEQ34_026162 [Dendrobium chrysotoxum]KAH0439463.1 hypothetical protein IEQ34_025906 [Dendrobium chrysotoxum]KAH0439854.1 hypothetical protein IEQ34_025798 [Dendrobium chrysotoxum]KAH0440089.1 hypothetical protein IEQ34_025738 [Dendrobium chrysotoxum]KAH0440305.1 hypothetical protein IEQ34_025674 [Dendrobium chrysotoxum]